MMCNRIREPYSRTVSSHNRAAGPLAVLLAICLCLSAVSGITIGVVDTVGGTTYDRQFLGPSWRMLANSAGHGVYVVWMYSADTTIGIPNLNMRFNYYDRALRKWVYAESMDFMSRGISAFPSRAGYGSIDVDTGGTPFISCAAYFGHAPVPLVERGTSGDYSDTTLLGFAYEDAPIAVDRNGSVHVLCSTDNGGMEGDLAYCRIAPDSWPHWSTPLTGIAPSAGWSPHNIAASKVSSKVALIWRVDRAYQMQSTDGGLTWDSTSELIPPHAYGGDTLTG